MQDSAGEENATNNVPHGSESFIEGRCAVCAMRCSLPDDAEIFNSPSLESDTKDNTQGNKD